MAFLLQDLPIDVEVIVIATIVKAIKAEEIVIEEVGIVTIYKIEVG